MSGNDDKPPADARFVDEYTPAPVDFGYGEKSPEAVELEICRSACRQQLLALSALQARVDEQGKQLKAKDEIITGLRNERALLARRIDQMKRSRGR